MRSLECDSSHQCFVTKKIINYKLKEEFSHEALKNFKRVNKRVNDVLENSSNLKKCLYIG
jgi:2-hydroxy-3-keto-5-methylthiopentenyl-1-phosphate phosphatase